MYALSHLYTFCTLPFTGVLTRVLLTAVLVCCWQLYRHIIVCVGCLCVCLCAQNSPSRCDRVLQCTILLLSFTIYLSAVGAPTVLGGDLAGPVDVDHHLGLLGVVGEGYLQAAALGDERWLVLQVADVEQVLLHSTAGNHSHSPSGWLLTVP